MLNNSFDLLEEILSDGQALDNKAEDFHALPPRADGRRLDALRDGAARADGDIRAECSGEDDPAYRQSRVDSLLWAYRDVGYLYADLNPLGESYSEEFTSLSQVKEKNFHRLGLEEFGLSDADLDAEFFAGGGLRATMPLRDILETFRRIYCGYIGVEFLHIQNKDMRQWLISRMEDSAYSPPLDEAQKRIILGDLVEAEELERFLQRTFIGQKRFSLEGSEAVIPALHFLLDGAAPRGIERIVMGASHRGRLSILSLIVGKPLEELLYLFEEGFTPGVFGGSDDVKYHIGYSSIHRNDDGSSVAISLAPNASHLESVGPIVEGRARGVQDRLGDSGGKRVLPVVIHGDAAIAGQGVVAETFNMSQLRGYGTGGSIHVVINNQIGFTTPSRDAHSNLNPTDIAKMNPVPVFHVNGDRPEEVVRVMRTALDFRQAFGSDVVVDIFCYRRLGHNEGDEPSFTHPFMYELIQAHPSAAAIYGAECVESGLVSAPELEKMRKDYAATLERALRRERAAPEAAAAPEGAVASEERGDGPVADTRVDEETLSRLVEGVSAVPPGMRIHDKLKSIVAGKLKAFRERGVLDWSLAEAAAFGSLLLEGVSVRLSGEDSERGTFSQRHLVWWEAGERTSSFYVPLDNLAPGQKKLAVYDSPLSEFGVLGFEYGYAAEREDALVMWEAQFGDFSNGGQVVIDNYIIAAEAKWGTADGLVLLLPHGYEGQGPEHSSAHLERFLLLCAEGNIRVAYPTTPAQYFHLLRAQAKDPVKKPLIIMTPKSLLRHPAALSPLADFAASGFRPLLEDPSPPDEARARAVLFCSGKIYYELARKKKEDLRTDVDIVRIERLYPFPEAELEKLLAEQAAATSFSWVQEEPRNRGAWNFVRENFEASFPKLELRYVGRRASASPATGSHERHASEQSEILAAAFGEHRGERP
jgi:2-oxoglutarate dehydrogenase E1 component